MGIGSGMGSSFGFSVETTYGTRVAPAKFVKHRSAAINRLPNRVQGEGIITGSFGPNLDHHVETFAGADATVAIDVPYAKMGPILQTLMGTSVTPAQQAATAAYLQTHILADTYGKALTCQVGVPYRDGTVKCHELVGGKITSAEFSCKTDGLLEANLQLDGQKFDDTQTLATVTHNAGIKAFHGGQMAFKVGTYNSEAAIKVRDVSVTIERPYDTEDYSTNSSGLKTQQVLNGPAQISGSVTLDWTLADGKLLQDLVVANTSNSVVIEWVSNVAIATTYFPTFRITLPSVTWTGDIQGADGANELTSKFDFTWRDDSSGNLPTIVYISTDTTL